MNQKKKTLFSQDLPPFLFTALAHMIRVLAIIAYCVLYCQLLWLSPEPQGNDLQFARIDRALESLGGRKRNLNTHDHMCVQYSGGTRLHVFNNFAYYGQKNNLDYR